MVEWYKLRVERLKPVAMNIKNPEAERLARELARRNGETITMAITVALKERLERQKANPKAGLAEWLDELSKKTAPLLKDLPPSDEIGDLLFDKETGLPL
jgi:antitoxin VapB